MVFSSFPFVLVFLPLVVVGFMLLQARALTVPTSWWLIAASLFFYGWWNVSYLPLPLLSIGFNYLVGRRLLENRSPRGFYLAGGVTANLLLLLSSRTKRRIISAPH